MPRVFRATSFVALAFCAFAAASCGDPFQIRAPFDTDSTSFAITAITRTPPSSRALWRIGDLAVFRLDSIPAQFDVGFDIETDGRVKVVPARAIALSTNFQGALTMPQVGVQTSTIAYADADRAPDTGYKLDTAVVVSRGQTVFITSASDFCQQRNTFGTQLFAKMIIDSVSLTGRTVYGRSTFQRSCNFRSLASGRPTF
jgi:hypothetical protein